MVRSTLCCQKRRGKDLYIAKRALLRSQRTLTYSTTFIYAFLKYSSLQWWIRNKKQQPRGQIYSVSQITDQRALLRSRRTLTCFITYVNTLRKHSSLPGDEFWTKRGEPRGQKYSVSQISTDLYFDPNCEALSQHYAVCCGAVLCDLIGFLTALK